MTPLELTDAPVGGVDNTNVKKGVRALEEKIGAIQVDEETDALPLTSSTGGLKQICT